MIFSEIWCVLSLILLIVSPVPITIYIVRSLRLSEGCCRAHSVFIHSVLWLLILGLLGVLLGVFHSINSIAAVVAESALLLPGLTIPFLSRRDRTEETACRKNNSITAKQYSELLLFTSGAIVVLYPLWKILTSPIYEYDSLAYHLPTMAKWFQSGSFLILDQFVDNPLSYYPYTWESLSLLFMIPFRGDFGVALPNLVACIVLGLSVYLVSHRFCGNRPVSAGMAVLLLAAPMMIEHVNTLHVDIALAAFFAASLYLAILYHDTRNTGYLVLLPATLGMMTGIKTTGIAYALLVLFSLIVMRIRDRIQGIPLPGVADSSPRRTLRILVGVVSFLILGAYWYLRNLILTGNPFGLIEISLGGHVLFAGQYSHEDVGGLTLASQFQFLNLEHWRILIGRFSARLRGSVVIFAAGSLTAAICFFVGKTKEKYRSLPLVPMLVVATALLYWVTPFSGDIGIHGRAINPWIGHQIRFAFPFLVLLAIVSSLGIARVRIPTAPFSIVIALLVADGISNGEIRSTAVIFIAVLGIAGLFWILPEILADVRVPRKLIAAALILVVPALLISTYRKRELAVVELYGPVVDYIENEVGPGETIGYLWGRRSYFYYGRRLSKKVVYVPAQGRTESEWIGSLRDRKIDIVAIGPIQPEWKDVPEEKWLEDRDLFVRIYGTDPTKESVLYRFKSTPGK